MTAKKPLPVKFYTVTEAAPMLGVGKSTLHRLITAGKVHYSLDAAGRRRFTADDIARNIADGQRPRAA